MGRISAIGLYLKNREKRKLGLEDPSDVYELLLSYSTAKKTEKKASSTNAQPFTVVGILLLLSGFSLIYPQLESLIRFLTNFHFKLLFENPMFSIGFFDLIMAALLFMGTAFVYPIARFRSLAGIAYFGYFF